MSVYDDLIEQAAAQFAGCTISPTPEREAALGRFIGEALRLRYGRLWVSRDDAIDLWWDVVETLRRALKAELVEILPGKLGGDPAVIERVLNVEMATMSRAFDRQPSRHRSGRTPAGVAAVPDSPLTSNATSLAFTSLLPETRRSASSLATRDPHWKSGTQIMMATWLRCELPHTGWPRSGCFSQRTPIA